MLETRSPVACVSPPDPETAAARPQDVCNVVTACVAHDFGLDADILRTTLRGSRRIAHARQVAMYLAHVGFGLSFEIVGQAFGRDRTTAAHACRAIEDCRDDIWFDCRVATLELVCAAALRRASR